MPKINIIYLLPQLKGASGGGKVIYNHSFILNKLDDAIKINKSENNIMSKIRNLEK